MVYRVKIRQVDQEALEDVMARFKIFCEEKNIQHIYLMYKNYADSNQFSLMEQMLNQLEAEGNVLRGLDKKDLAEIENIDDILDYYVHDKSFKRIIESLRKSLTIERRVHLKDISQEIEEDIVSLFLYDYKPYLNQEEHTMVSDFIISTLEKGSSAKNIKQIIFAHRKYYLKNENANHRYKRLYDNLKRVQHEGVSISIQEINSSTSTT